MYKVIFLTKTRKQIDEALEYLVDELYAPEAAENLLNDIERVAQSLEEMPYRYPIYRTLYAMRHEIRFVPVKNYNLFYLVNEQKKCVEIWRFLHQRRKMRAIEKE